MASVTAEQVELLVLMVEAKSIRFQIVEMLSEPAALVGDHDDQWEVNPRDVRELADLGLLRAVGNAYEVTNSGRAAYAQIKNPPEPKAPVGFQPQS